MCALDDPAAGESHDYTVGRSLDRGGPRSVHDRHAATGEDGLDNTCGVGIFAGQHAIA